eukprot:365672-Chlamydomonas_euryale.AAC.14
MNKKRTLTCASIASRPVRYDATLAAAYVPPASIVRSSADANTALASINEAQLSVMRPRSSSALAASSRLRRASSASASRLRMSRALRLRHWPRKDS